LDNGWEEKRFRQKVRLFKPAKAPGQKQSAGSPWSLEKGNLKSKGNGEQTVGGGRNHNARGGGISGDESKKGWGNQFGGKQKTKKTR